jgi:hypothetical protein
MFDFYTPAILQGYALITERDLMYVFWQKKTS